MKKILPIMVVGILIISGLGAVGTQNERIIFDNSTDMNESITLTIPQLNIKDDSNYFELELNEVSNYLSEPGKPMLPKIVKTFELPFGANNIRVDVIPENIKEQTIEKLVEPSPYHLLLTSANQNLNEDDIKIIKESKNDEIYSSKTPYPESWYKYSVTSGMNEKFERVTNVAIHIYPIKYAPALNTLYIAESVSVKISYEADVINPFSYDDEYDLVVIAPEKFISELNRLVEHKNSIGVSTILKTTEEIYNEYTGVDKPEQIKYFIQDAIETNNIKYVLLVGGLKSKIWNNPREHMNYGARWWWVPARYQNFYDDPEHPLTIAKIHDPGVLSDLYYADVYKEGGVFNDWDPNGDGIIAAWGMEGVENDTGLDLDPDVSVGRLACRNTKEVKDVVDKIIQYESGLADDSWFKKAISISGDGFLDQQDLNFEWNTTGLPNGDYIVKAQSQNKDMTIGDIEETHITINKDEPTFLSFNHNDNERVSTYPAPPVAEIVCPSDGDNLGYNDSLYIPSEGIAYGNSVYGWADCEYENETLHIRGKTYDPRAYGYITDIHVWVENEDADVVYSDWRYDSTMYYEGEWITGEQTIKGGGGALYYLPEDFDRELMWASNGNFKDQAGLIDSWSQGAGFVFMSGHGSPNQWGDHWPGIPGNRKYGSFTGLLVISPKLTFPFFNIPAFPMTKIKNTDKLSIVLIGGCHNSQFNVSMINALLDLHNEKNTWCHGTPVPECFSWAMVSVPNQGAIASMGNTGLGYGVLGDNCLIEGLDGGICIEFYKQYAEDYNTEGYGILGNAYSSTLNAYVETYDMEFLDHAKSLTQWVLLGDPSLRIGGYPS